MTLAIACAKCSHWSNGRRVQVTHASIAEVRECTTGQAEKVVKINSQVLPVPGAHAILAAAAAEAEVRNEAAAAAAVAAAAPVSVDPEKLVPAGHYAVKGTDGKIKFYRVDRPTEGPWKGYTFVKVQAGDDFHPVKDRSRRMGILAAILVDAKGASVLYGRELGRCGVCNRTLTDPDSIAAGIGPVCAGRF